MPDNRTTSNVQVVLDTLLKSVEKIDIEVEKKVEHSNVPLKLYGTDENGEDTLYDIGGTTQQVNSDWNATEGVAEILNKPEIGEAQLTIQKNSIDIDTFNANATTDKTINIIVPTQASDVNALPDSTKYVANASMTIDSTTYIVTLQLKDQDGNNIGTEQTINLPLESVVVNGRYDSLTKEIVLVLENGTEIKFSVADLVSGLQTEITSNNKLDADLVDDSTSINKFVTSNDITTWNNKQDKLTAGKNITIEKVSEAGETKTIISASEVDPSRYNYEKISNYLYYADFEADLSDENYAIQYFEDNFHNKDSVNIPLSFGACSSIRKGNFYGRNYDWYYNKNVSFVVHNKAVDNKYESIGMAQTIFSDMEPEVLGDKIKLIPYFMLDGINSNGVFVNNNVVPTGDLGVTTGTHSDLSGDYICQLMLPRYILDHFATATEAVEWIRDEAKIFAPRNAKTQLELHFMIGDSTKTYIVEFINNEAVIIDVTNSKSAVMTNFYKQGTTYDENGHIDFDSVTNYGAGLERYNLLVDGYDSVDSIESMRNCIDLVQYTKAYTEIYTDPVAKIVNPNTWKTEWAHDYSDSTVLPHPMDLHANSPLSDYEYSGILEVLYNMYQNRSRETGTTWQTVHSSVYDIEKQELYLKVQEGNKQYHFVYPNPSRILQNIDEEVERAKAAETILDEKINTEEQARIDADTALSNRIIQNTQDITYINNELGTYGDIVTHDVNEFATVAFSGDYSDLNNIPSFSNVAYSGDYGELNNIPNFANIAMTGDYSDLNNIPSFSNVAYSGDYGELNNIPNFATVAFSGDYSDLNNIPSNTTYLSFPGTWPVTSTHTTFQFCQAVANDDTAMVGNAYLGEVTLSDIVTLGLGNAELIVTIMDGVSANDKVIHLVLTSGNHYPYRWEYTYWNNGVNVSGWIGFEPELPDQTYCSGQFLKTNGVSKSWSNVTGNDIYTIYNNQTTTSANTSLSSFITYNYGTLNSLIITLPVTLNVNFVAQVNFTSNNNVSNPTSFAIDSSVKMRGDDVSAGTLVPALNKRYSILFYYDGVQVRGIVQGESV